MTDRVELSNIVLKGQDARGLYELHTPATEALCESQRGLQAELRTGLTFDIEKIMMDIRRDPRYNAASRYHFDIGNGEIVFTPLSGGSQIRHILRPVDRITTGLEANAHATINTAQRIWQKYCYRGESARTRPVERSHGWDSRDVTPDSRLGFVRLDPRRTAAATHSVAIDRPFRLPIRPDATDFDPTPLHGRTSHDHFSVSPFGPLMPRDGRTLSLEELAAAPMPELPDHSLSLGDDETGDGGFDAAAAATREMGETRRSVTALTGLVVNGDEATRAEITKLQEQLRGAKLEQLQQLDHMAALQKELLATREELAKERARGDAFFAQDRATAGLELGYTSLAERQRGIIAKLQAAESALWDQYKEATAKAAKVELAAQRKETQLLQRITALTGENGDLRKKLGASLAKEQELLQVIHQHEQRAARQERRIEGMATHLARLSGQHDHAVAQLRTTSATLEQQKAAYAQALIQLSALGAENDQVRAALLAVQEEFAQANGDHGTALNALRQEILALKVDNESIRSGAIESLEALSVAQIELSKLKQAQASLKEENAHLVAQMEHNSRLFIAQLEQQEQAAKQRYEAIARDLSKALADENAARRELSILQEQSEGFTEALTAAEAEIEAQTTRIAELEAQAAQFGQSDAELRGELGKIRAALAAASAAKLGHLNSGLGQALQVALGGDKTPEQQIAALLDAIAKYEAEVVKLGASESLLKTELAQVKAQLATATAANGKLEAAVKALEALAAKLEASQQQTAQQQAAIAASIDALGDMESAEGEALVAALAGDKTPDAQIALLTQAIKDFEARIQALSTENQELNDELEKAHSVASAATTTLAQERTRWEADKTNLERQLREAEERLANAQSNIAGLAGEELDATLRSVAAFDNLNLEQLPDTLADKVKALMATIQGYQANITTLKQKCAQLDRELATARSTISDLEAAALKTTALIQQLQADLVQSRQETGTERQAKDAFERQVKALEQQLAQLTAGLDDSLKDSAGGSVTPTGTLSDKIKALQGKLRALQAKADRDASDAEATHRAKDKATSQMEDAYKVKLADLQARVEALTNQMSDYDANKRELAAAKSELAALKSKLQAQDVLAQQKGKKTFDELAADALRQVDELGAKLTADSTANGTTLEKLRAAVQQKQKRIADLEATNAGLLKQLAERDVTIQQLNDRLALQERTHTAALSRIAALEHALSAKAATDEDVPLAYDDVELRDRIAVWKSAEDADAAGKGLFSRLHPTIRNGRLDALMDHEGREANVAAVPGAILELLKLQDTPGFNPMRVYNLAIYLANWTGHHMKRSPCFPALQEWLLNRALAGNETPEELSKRDILYRALAQDPDQHCAALAASVDQIRSLRAESDRIERLPVQHRWQEIRAILSGNDPEKAELRMLLTRELQRAQNLADAPSNALISLLKRKNPPANPMSVYTQATELASWLGPQMRYTACFPALQQWLRDRERTGTLSIEEQRARGILFQACPALRNGTAPVAMKLEDERGALKAPQGSATMDLRGLLSYVAENGLDARSIVDHAIHGETQFVGGVQHNLYTAKRQIQMALIEMAIKRAFEPARMISAISGNGADPEAEDITLESEPLDASHFAEDERAFSMLQTAFKKTETEPMSYEDCATHKETVAGRIREHLTALTGLTPTKTTVDALLEHVQATGEYPHALRMALHQKGGGHALALAKLLYYYNALNNYYKAGADGQPQLADTRFTDLASLDQWTWLLQPVGQSTSEAANQHLMFLKALKQDPNFNGNPLTRQQAVWAARFHDYFAGDPNPKAINADFGMGKTATVQFMIRYLKEHSPQSKNRDIVVHMLCPFDVKPEEGLVMHRLAQTSGKIPVVVKGARTEADLANHIVVVDEGHKLDPEAEIELVAELDSSVKRVVRHIEITATPYMSDTDYAAQRAAKMNREFSRQRTALDAEWVTTNEAIRSLEYTTRLQELAQQAEEIEIPEIPALYIPEQVKLRFNTTTKPLKDALANPEKAKTLAAAIGEYLKGLDKVLDKSMRGSHTFVGAPPAPGKKDAPKGDPVLHAQLKELRDSLAALQEQATAFAAYKEQHGKADPNAEQTAVRALINQYADDAEPAVTLGNKRDALTESSRGIKRTLDSWSQATETESTETAEYFASGDKRKARLAESAMVYQEATLGETFDAQAAGREIAGKIQPTDPSRLQVILPGVKFTKETLVPFAQSLAEGVKGEVRILYRNSYFTDRDHAPGHAYVRIYRDGAFVGEESAEDIIKTPANHAGKIIMLYDWGNQQGGDFGKWSRAEGNGEIQQLLFYNYSTLEPATRTDGQVSRDPIDFASEIDVCQAMGRRRQPKGIVITPKPRVFANCTYAKFSEKAEQRQAQFEQLREMRKAASAIAEKCLKAECLLSKRMAPEAGEAASKKRIEYWEKHRVEILRAQEPALAKLVAASLRRTAENVEDAAKFDQRWAAVKRQLRAETELPGSTGREYLWEADAAIREGDLRREVAEKYKETQSSRATVHQAKRRQLPDEAEDRTPDATVLGTHMGLGGSPESSRRGSPAGLPSAQKALSAVVKPAQEPARTPVVNAGLTGKAPLAAHATALTTHQLGALRPRNAPGHLEEKSGKHGVDPISRAKAAELAATLC